MNKRSLLVALAVTVLAIGITLTATSGVFTNIVRNNTVDYGARYSIVQALTGADNLAVPNTGVYFNLSGTVKITRIQPPTIPSTVPSATAARVIVFRLVSTDTLADGVNLKLAGNLNGTADDVIELVWNASGAAADTFWTEKSRSAN